MHLVENRRNLPAAKIRSTSCFFNPRKKSMLGGAWSEPDFKTGILVGFELVPGVSSNFVTPRVTESLSPVRNNPSSNQKKASARPPRPFHGCLACTSQKGSPPDCAKSPCIRELVTLTVSLEAEAP